MTPLRQRTLQVAKRFVGASENIGPNRGTVIERFQLFIGRWMIAQPWCVAFSVYCVYRAANELKMGTDLLKTASSSALYTWAKRHGRLLTKPEAGCILLVRAGGAGDSDGRADHGKSHIHCGLVHTVEADGTLVTIEGNFGNKVKWNRRRATGLDFVRI